MTKKRKIGKAIEEQINEMFKLIPNDQVKEAFIDSLENQFDISEERETLIGVGDISDLNLNELEALNSFGSIDELRIEHKKNCQKCSEDEDCEDYDFIDENIEESYKIFTDGKFVETQDGKIKIENDNITIQINYNRNTFQIIKSPTTDNRGLCSMSYPNQADLDRKGDYKTFILPEYYKL